MNWSTIIQILEGFMNIIQALLQEIKQREGSEGASSPTDLGAMRGKGDFDINREPEFAPPKRTRMSSPITRPTFSKGDTTTGGDGNTAQPEPYKWADMAFYPSTPY